MKIRPKPRKYNKGEEMDESYFATNSNEDGNMSREEVTPSGGDKSGFFDTSKREFKILDKKIDSKNYSSNKVQTSEYNLLNFIPFNLVKQISKRHNAYFIVVMIM